MSRSRASSAIVLLGSLVACTGSSSAGPEILFPDSVDMRGICLVLGEKAYSTTSELRADIRADALTQELTACVVPAPSLWISYWGLPEHGEDYVPMCRKLTSRNGAGFDLLELLFQVNNSTLDDLRNADHRYLESNMRRVDLKERTERGLLPHDDVAEPVYEVHCGS